jgi:hypothetical protein
MIDRQKFEREFFRMLNRVVEPTVEIGNSSGVSGRSDK